MNLFFFLFINTVLKSSDILQVYDLNKKNLKENSILETEQYLYTVSVSKKNKILDVSIKKNQLKAEVKLLDRII